MKQALYSPTRRLFSYARCGALVLALSGLAAKVSAQSFTLSTYTVGNTPNGVAVGDVNNDGKLDAVTANYTASTLSVLLGNGTGGLTLQATAPATDTYPQCVTLADINNDGKLDALTGNGGVNALSVLLGDGAGSFTRLSYTPLNSTYLVNVYNLGVGDVNNDGKLDVVCYYSGGTLAVLLGNGAGGFTMQANSPSLGGTNGNNRTAERVLLADLNSDGKLDVVATDRFSSVASVLLGNGAGGFTLQANSPSLPSSPNFSAVADVNADGKPDLLATYSSTTGVPPNTVASGNLSVLLGNGAGTFTLSNTYALSAPPSGVAVGDVSTDGKLDALVTTSSGSTLNVLLGNGTGAFNAPTTISTGTGSNPSAPVVADLNGDARLDVLNVNAGGNTLLELLNTTTLSYCTPTGGDCTNEYIRGVTLNTLSNVGTGCTGTGGYNDYTSNAALTTTLSQGSTYALTVSLHINSSPAAAGVWIDYDHSGTFDAGEFTQVYSFTGTYTGGMNVSGTVNITVPTSALIGATRLRVRSANSSVPLNASGACTNNFYGEVEDYLVTIGAPDLIVSTTGQTIAAGTYNTITVQNGGVGTMAGNVTVNSAVTVQNGGTLNDGCAIISGNGTFTLAAGGTLGICAAQGIMAAPTLTGAIQNTGTRTFNSDASYVYNGTAAQVTGGGLPGTVRNLTTTNNNAVTLSQAAIVNQVVTVGGSGNLVLNGNALTLPSSASGTALVVNSGTGIVQGATATMQRYIDASGNTGASGYRHYSSPVSGATVSSFSTSAYGGSFTAQVNPLYNTQNPTTLPAATYPNVFLYDESKFFGSPAVTFTDFDKRYQSPQALTDPLAVGRGYAVQIGNGEKVQFTGTLTTGTQTIGNLYYTQLSTAANTGTSAGWALIGNPYPAPLDWGTVSNSSFNGVFSAAYVFQSTSAYSGRYTSFTNGVGAGTGLMAAGQAFFVRSSSIGSAGSITLTNANRATTYGATPAFQRQADPRPLLRLSLGLGSGAATVATTQDETFVYFEQGATANFDGSFDAYKLANPSGYYLGTASADADPLGLSISGRAPLTSLDDVVPVWLSVPAGAYTLTATELRNMGTMAGGTTVYLRDAQLGTLTNLNTTSSYSFSVAAGAASTGRFALVFRTSAALATQPAALRQTLATIYPNPTAGAATLSVTGLPVEVRSLQADLYDALGRAVGHLSLTPTQGAATASLVTEHLAGGVYVLRLSAHDAQGHLLDTLPAQRLSVR